MPLPEFNVDGDLPAGIHRATIEEIVARFGSPGTTRKRCTTNLRHIFELANATGQLERMIIFGSYVSAKNAPNDVDVILVMRDAFNPKAVSSESRPLFDHAVAQSRFGASIFWVTESIALGAPMDVFLSHWQRKREAFAALWRSFHDRG